MATENPTGDDRALALKIPAGNLPFLRRVIGAARQGLRDDLARFGDELQQPRGSLLVEDMVYLILLDALDQRWVFPDPEIRPVLARLAESVDHDNDYARVVFEHDALRDLLAQLEGGAS